MIETIRLFKALCVKDAVKKEASEVLLKYTIQYGFIFSPEVINNYSYTFLFDLVKIMKNDVTLSPEQINSSFHKSWNKIKTTDRKQLILEQIVHYITTYGFESLGVYDDDSIYIPTEKLDIPEINVENINLTVIKGYTELEFKEKIMNLLKSGIALKKETIEDIIVVCDKFELMNATDIEVIKNKEIKMYFYKKYNMFPENNVEFLRYMIYLSTESFLLIKNNETIESIIEGNSVYNEFNGYKLKYGLENLAEIFLRFKSLFLAFRKNDERLKPIINKIRKLSDKHHKPMPEDYLNIITAKIKNNENIDIFIFKNELSKVNTFRKIRLLYALNYRLQDVDSIMYKVRNGKAYSKDFSFNCVNKNVLPFIIDIVYNSIVGDVSSNVKGKKIFIPDYVNYALPATEKQFTGNFPNGSYIEINKNMVFGVHWFNGTHKTVDLDLSMLNGSDGKIGWDAQYRSNGVLFSGDITSAPRPKGASELFYIDSNVESSYIVVLNYYNYEEDIPVPFKIVVAKENIKNLEQNYMVDPNNVITIANSVIDKKQKILGFVDIEEDICKFYFSESYIGNSISSDSEYSVNSLKYLTAFCKNSIYLDTVLRDAGAILFPDKEDCDIDLSLENLEKDTILNLIISNE